MGDTISRQAAIDAFCKECYDTDGEICDRDNVCGNVMILKNMPSTQPEQRWIPCSERLPDIDDEGYTDKVLVSFDKYGGVEICEYRIINDVGKWYAGDTDDAPEDLGLRITAWMPLPEPYKGGQE